MMNEPSVIRNLGPNETVTMKIEEEINMETIKQEPTEENIDIKNKYNVQDILECKPESSDFVDIPESIKVEPIIMEDECNSAADFMEMTMCERIMDSGNLQKHEQSDRNVSKDNNFNGMHQTNKCSFQSKHKRFLHKNASLGQMFKCSECSYKTKYKGNIYAHMLVHNEPDSMFKCTECSQQYKREDNLRRHMLFTHLLDLQNHMLVRKDPLEIKMFRCTECSYQSSLETNLQAHILIHKDPSLVPRFKCEKCSYQYLHKERLQRHMLVHKDPSQVRIFECDKCSYQTKWKQKFQHHMQVHVDPSLTNMFKCNECGQGRYYRGCKGCEEKERRDQGGGSRSAKKFREDKKKMADP